MRTIQTIYQAQKQFFDTGKTQSVKYRIQKLKELKEIIIKAEQKIYEALRADLNKPIEEAFLGEFMGIMHELGSSISKLKQWAKMKRRSAPLLVFPSKASVLPEPYGQVLIISPWNYPLDLSLSPLVGAIAAGNTAILKPSEFTPHTSQLLSELLTSVFPQEYVYVQQGDAEVSKELLKLRFDYIFFTGSVSVGREIMKMAAEHLTPVTLELGGKCPVIITRNSNLKKAAKSIAWGKFFNAGQSCVAPDYVLVHEEDFKEFTSHFKQYLSQFLKNKENDYTRIINKKHFNRLLSYLGQGDIIYGGDSSLEELYLSPTLIIPESNQCTLMKDEIFGPVLPLIKYQDTNEIFSQVKSLEKPLVAYIFSNSKKEIKYFMNNISSGSICINDTMLNYVNKNLPFGGVGHSGIGQYHGKDSFDTFSNHKGIHQKLIPDFPFRYPPYQKQYKLLRPFKTLLNKNI